MPELEADLYDHEQETASRRAVADWGGDDVFATAPRRRFARPERGGAHTRPLDHPAPRGADAADHAAGRRTDAPDHAAGRRTDAPDHAAGRRTVLITGRPEPLSTRGGAAATAPARRRPPRTVDQRIGGRPERVAGWACGLGLLLILVAVSTADAAPL